MYRIFWTHILALALLMLPPFGREASSATHLIPLIVDGLPASSIAHLVEESTLPLLETRATPQALTLTELGEDALLDFIDAVNDSWLEGDLTRILAQDWDEIARARGWTLADARLWEATRDALLTVLTVALIDADQVIAQAITRALLTRFDAARLCEGAHALEACEELMMRSDARPSATFLDEEGAHRYSAHSGLPLLQVRVQGERYEITHTLNEDVYHRQVGSLEGDEDPLAVLCEALARTLRRDEVLAAPSSARPGLDRVTRAAWVTSGAVSAAAVGLHAWNLRNHRRLRDCVDLANHDCRGSGAVEGYRARVQRSRTSAWAVTGVALTSALTATTFTIQRRPSSPQARPVDGRTLEPPSLGHSLASGESSAAAPERTRRQP